jgi:GT2 family glycosyltransferase
MDPVPPRQPPLAEALARVAWGEGQHRRSLVEQAAEALRLGDARLAWLLSDRLARLSHRRSAIPHILRASALARLGVPDEASADLGLALAIDPHNPLLQQALLDIGTPEDRRKSAAMLLAQPDGLKHDRALAAFAGEGVALIIHAAAAEGRLTAHLRWRGEPRLTIRASDGVRHFDLEAVGTPMAGTSAFPFGATLALSWPSHSEALTLRPVAPLRHAAIPPVLYRPEGAPAEAPARPLGEAVTSLLIVVPVYGDLAATKACLDSLAAARGGRGDWRVVVVEDAAPDPAMAPMLGLRAQAGEFTLLRNPLNLGFARSVNRALATRHPGEDVLLLNADTVVPPGAIDRLAAAVHAEATIGTATPLSNNGEDTSVPRRFSANPMPEPGEIARLDRLAQQANPGQRIDMPNGVGFCLYVKGAMLDRTGPLSPSYGRGYYEDVDLCLRGSEGGYRHVCAADVFVGHSGTLSFKGAKAALVRSNLVLLEERFPAHRERALSFHRSDPLKPAACRLEALWLREAPEPLPLVVVPPSMPLWLVRQMAGIHAPRRTAVVARATRAASGLAITLTATDSGMPQNLTIELPPDQASPVRIAAELAACRFGSVLLVDPSDVDPALAEACRRLDLPRCLGLASAYGMAAGPPLDHRGGTPLVLPGALALGIGTILGWEGMKGPPRPPEPPAPKPGGDGSRPDSLAILAEGAAGGEWELAGEVAQALDALRSETMVAFVGEPAEGAAPSARLFPSGTMARAEAPAWLTRLGAGACLIASRAYGIADPRADAWPRAGFPTAYFDPRAFAVEAEPLRLRLPLQMTDAEAAAAVTGWFGAITRARLAGLLPVP